MAETTELTPLTSEDIDENFAKILSGQLEKLEATEKISSESLIEEANKGPSKSYTGQHVYVWWSKNSFDGEWNLHHTYPVDLAFRLQIRKAGINDNQVIYGKKFVKYTHFDYSDRQLNDLSMRVNKYSLTPNGAEEKENRELCEKAMKKRGLNVDLTQRINSRFPQK